jgi:aryl-alcohol dehydrogenase-like predicted oxidoreductase
MSLKVEYRRLGKSGLRVSVPILGAMSFGTNKWWGDWVINEDKVCHDALGTGSDSHELVWQALELLKAAWERGVTTWDTADTYSNGESERIIGKAIREVSLPFLSCLIFVTPNGYRLVQLKIPRHRIQILTKCYFIVHDEPGIFTATHPHLGQTRDYVNQFGLSRAAIFHAVNSSLKRLGTDYIDLLQIHRSDLDNVTAEETMKALHDLVTIGKVRYIGASSMWTWQFAHYNQVAEKVKVAAPHSQLRNKLSDPWPTCFRMAGPSSSQCRTIIR